MDGFSLRRFSLGFALLTCLLSLAVPYARAATQDSTIARSMLDDAELHAITFVDREHGWAVGDRGVIWATTDGGRSWRLQVSGCDAVLTSVSFLDAENGWVAGARYRPYLNSTTGVLLRTRDGGQSWEEEKGMPLPAIKYVKFFGPQQGWIVAEPSDIFPSGLFFTDAGGRVWVPVSDREVSAWTVADFATSKVGALIGSHGARGVVNERQLERHEQTELGLREPRAVRMATPSEAWLVGDYGLLQVTHDGGRIWEAAPQEPPGGAHFDFRAVELRAGHAWVAGFPGSRVFHSPDGGTTWNSTATNQNLPLNALSFVDTEHGWGAGALGTIISTNDGGRTWQSQRGPRRRAAVLAVFSDPDRVPLEAVARAAANEGFITAVEWVGRRDAEPDTPPAATQSVRDRAAMLSLGCSAADRAWGFPLRQQGVDPGVEQIVASWNRMYAEHGAERLQEHLVRAIRTWRPELVLTTAASPGGDDPLGHFVNQVVLRAVADAAVADKYAEQTAAAGLAPWSVKKVAGSMPAGKSGTISVNTAQLAPRLVKSLSDYALPARGLLNNTYRAPPSAWGFRLYTDHVPQGAGQQDLFSGIALEAGSDARRDVPSTSRAGIEGMRLIAERHRNMQAILTHSERTGRGPGVLGQISELTRGLDADTAGQALFELAHTYHIHGHWDLAAATFEMIAEKHPTHPLSVPAVAWLVQYWASGEAACRAQAFNGPQPDVATAPKSGRNSGIIPATALVPVDQNGAASLIGTEREQSIDTTSVAGRLAKADLCGKALERLDTVAWADMHVQFPLAVARATPGVREPDRFLAMLVGTRPQDSWWACARSEQWARGLSREAPPKATSIARAAVARPRLDGHLEDEVWQTAERLELKSSLSDDAEWPATALVAYDAEFLYLALSCRLAQEARYVEETRTRERDADLSMSDRVELLIDLDRDFTTFYRLCVDYRGWTTEDCWGDSTWNPRWFVAADRDNEEWTIEAAIPLAELSRTPAASKTVWALGLQRIVPNVGFQSWSRPATVHVSPQGFGYLVFE